MMLQDSAYTKILIVALPETTPVLEASALQDDLRRAGIEPYAWVINASLAAAHPRDPLLRPRAAELPQIVKVKEARAACCARGLPGGGARGRGAAHGTDQARPRSGCLPYGFLRISSVSVSQHLGPCVGGGISIRGMSGNWH